MYNEQDKVRQKKQLHARAFIRETFTYFVFLIIFVWSSSKQVSNMTFPMVDSIRGGLIGSEWTRGKEFVAIRTVGEYWDWFDKVFLPNLRPQFWYGTGRTWDSPLSPQEKRYTQTHNFVLGTFRMRQVRVRKNANCEVNVKLELSVHRCYGPYSGEAEEKASYGPWNDTSTNASSAFVWQATEKLCEAALLEGYCTVPQFAKSWPSSGYALDFEVDYAPAAKQAKFLKDNRWIDVQTRVILIDFVLYNPSIELLAGVQVTSQVSETGHWLNRVDVKPMPLYDMEGLSAKGVLAAEVVLFVLVVIYIFAEFWEFGRYARVKSSRCTKCQIDRVMSGATTNHWIYCVECSREFNPFRQAECPTCTRETQGESHLCWKGYFLDGWNILDIINQVFFLYLFIWRLKLRYDMWKIDFAGVDQQFKILYPMAWQFSFTNWLNAVNALLCFAKLFKYMGKFRALSTLIRTLSMGAKDLAWFTLLFIIFWTGYAFAFHLAFGATVEGFREWGSSMMTTFLYLLGDFDFPLISDASRPLAIILFVSYMVIFPLILLNVFISIVIEAFEAAKAFIRSGKEDYIGSALTLTFHQISFKLKLGTGSTMLPEVRKLIHRFEGANLEPEQVDDLRAFRNEVEHNPFNTELFSAVVSAFGGKVDRPMRQSDFQLMKKAVKGWRQLQKDREQGLAEDVWATGVSDEESDADDEDQSVATGSRRSQTTQSSIGGSRRVKDKANLARYQSSMKLVLLNPHQQEFHNHLKKLENRTDQIGNFLGDLLKAISTNQDDDLHLESASELETNDGQSSY